MPDHPRIGELRQLVTVQQEVRAGSGDSLDMTWQDLAADPRRAKIAPLDGYTEILAATQDDDTTHQIWVRYDSAIAPGMRVVEGQTDSNDDPPAGARIWHIKTAANPDMKRRFLRLAVAQGGAA